MAITATTKILTLDYWKIASHLKVGDYVFDRNGKIVRIKTIQQYMAQECYEVTFNDHLSIAGDIHLSFPTENPKYRNRAHTYKGRWKFRRPLKELSVKDLLELPLLDRRNRLVYSVQTAKPLELPHQDLPVPPFVFGFWFFSRINNDFFSLYLAIRDFVREKFKDYGYKVTWPSKRRKQFTTTPKIALQLIPNIPRFIPSRYLLASPEQRQELLSGIMCAKPHQYNKKTDNFRFTSRVKDTTQRVQMLAESLGCKTRMQYDESMENYTVFFKCRLPIYPDQASPPIKIYHARRYIREINPIPAQMCVHIETDGPDNTFLTGEGFISAC